MHRDTTSGGHWQQARKTCFAKLPRGYESTFASALLLLEEFRDAIAFVGNKEEFALACPVFEEPRVA